MTFTMEIQKRNLTLREAEIISKEIRLTNNIIGYKTGELVDFKNTFIATDGKALVGILTYVELEHWIDLKILIILKEYRGKGYGKELFDYSFEKAEELNKSLYTVTRNPVLVSLLEEKGFGGTSLSKLPISVILHQAKMIFSIYRIKEYIRKRPEIKRGEKFQYFALRR